MVAAPGPFAGAEARWATGSEAPWTQTRASGQLGSSLGLLHRSTAHGLAEPGDVGRVPAEGLPRLPWGLLAGVCADSPSQPFLRLPQPSAGLHRPGPRASVPSSRPSLRPPRKAPGAGPRPSRARPGHTPHPTPPQRFGVGHPPASVPRAGFDTGPRHPGDSA